jgi:predicted MPP superfamily phosphohydrolase
VVTRHSLTLPAGDGKPCRLAFVSDIHVGPTTPIELLQRVFDLIRAERPDVLLLGGDYVYLEAEPHRMDVLGLLVRSVEAPVTLAVLGNHDLCVYVSRGIGTVELPVRTFAPPDILLLELVRPPGRAPEAC